MPNYARVEETPDGIVRYRVRRQDKGRVWFYYPAVDLHTGECLCTCKGFECVRTKQAEAAGLRCDIHNPATHCRHLSRVILDLIDRGIITTTL